MVPAYKQCTSPNSSHVGPLNNPSCTPPAQESSLLTTSTVGRGLASAYLYAILGDTGTMADEADFSISASATDVLNKVGGTEYTGKVILTTQMRVTDRSNGYSSDEGGTVQDVQFSVPFDCVHTTDTDSGGQLQRHHHGGHAAAQLRQGDEAHHRLDVLVQPARRRGGRQHHATLGRLPAELRLRRREAVPDSGSLHSVNRPDGL